LSAIEQPFVGSGLPRNVAISGQDGRVSYDVSAIRRCFPALAEGAAHFDGPGGSQVPTAVADDVAATLSSAIANRGSVTAAERRAETIVRAARQAMADLLGCDPGGVVFGRSMTALTYDMARTLAKDWRPGDEVVVTRLDHDANIRPWLQAATAVGATCRWAAFDRESGELPAEEVTGLLSGRTRLVAVTGASNLLGTRPDVRAIADATHSVGALLYVDGVHLTAHLLVDVGALGADFYACSPYKFLGPHLGVLASAPDLLRRLRPDKLLPSSDEVPERYELGTLPYELLAGTTAAVDFLAGLVPSKAEVRRGRLAVSLAALEQHEARMSSRLEAGLAALPGVALYSRAGSRTPTTLFSVAGCTPGQVYRELAARGVNAPAGSFYAVEAARWLGLGDQGAVRAGIAPYSDVTDVDRLVQAVAALVCA
jgi:cysteine desulfurase family protein (TIGR01976 family)